MSGLYSPDGGWNVTLVSEDDSPVGLYASDGSIRMTYDAGSGVYAPNGALRISNLPGLYTDNKYYPNMSGQSLIPKAKSAIAKIRSGVPGSRFRWGMVSTSLGTGWGDNGSPNSASGASGAAGTAPNVLRSKAMAAHLAARFEAEGIPTRKDAVWGGNGLVGSTIAGYNAYNPNVVLTSDWSLVTGNRVIGNELFRLATSGTSAFTLTPEIPADTLEIWHPTFTGSGTGGITVSDSSGVLANIDFRVAPNGGFAKSVATRPEPSVDPFVITRWSGASNPTGECNITALVPFDSTTPQVEIWNMGWGNSLTSDWIQQAAAYGALPSLGVIPQELISVDLGVNDIANAVSTATFTANMQTIVNGLYAGADHLLIESHAAKPTTEAHNLPDDYRVAIRSIAASKGLMVPPNFANAGLDTAVDYFDAIHLVETGYTKEAQYLFNLIRIQLGI